MPLDLIAHLTFWAVVLVTAMHARWRRALVFVGLWAIGFVASGFLPIVGGFLFGSYVAVLDIVMLILVKVDIAGTQG